MILLTQLVASGCVVRMSLNLMGAYEARRVNTAYIIAASSVRLERASNDSKCDHFLPAVPDVACIHRRTGLLCVWNHRQGGHLCAFFRHCRSNDSSAGYRIHQQKRMRHLHRPRCAGGADGSARNRDFWQQSAFPR